MGPLILTATVVDDFPAPKISQRRIYARGPEEGRGQPSPEKKFMLQHLTCQWRAGIIFNPKRGIKMGRLHGILSLAFITMAGFIALVWLFRKSTMLGVAYLIVAGLSSLIILYSYCAKCVARDQDCSHVFPGKFTRWLPERKAGPYRLVDQLATGVSLAAIFLFPQYWLWQSKVILVIFWTLAAVALAEILLRVCPNCGNLNCILCRMRG